MPQSRIMTKGQAMLPAPNLSADQNAYSLPFDIGLLQIHLGTLMLSGGGHIIKAHTDAKMVSTISAD